MSYKFTKINENENDSHFRLLEEGIYDFEILASHKKISSKGNLMASLELKVTNDKGKQFYMFDNLVFIDNPYSLKKLKLFCECVGKEKEYEADEISEDLDGLVGKMIVAVEPEKPKEGGGVYRAKNIVVEYLPPVLDKDNLDEFYQDGMPF